MTYKEIYKALRKKVLKDYGKRCGDVAWGCGVCEAWIALDFVKDASLIEKDL